MPFIFKDLQRQELNMYNFMETFLLHVDIWSSYISDKM